MAASENDDKGCKLEEEKEHFQRVCTAFSYYRTFAMRRVARAHENFSSLPLHHQRLLKDFLPNLDRLKAAIDVNHEFIDRLMKSAQGMFVNSRVADTLPRPVDDPGRNGANGCIAAASSFDMEKVKTAIKQFFRDWSAEGATERHQCYGPILNELKILFPLATIDGSHQSVSVLVPGSGLGRLAYQIARLGYRCQGNEWSMFMLIASHFILNQVKGINVFVIYPWVHNFSNNMTVEDQLRSCHIPDVDPHDLPPSVEFSMTAGDFNEVYTEPDVWDCVATCYFIDTSPNVVAYIETVKRILKPGGYWINFGPLLYHFSDMSNEQSVELSYETIQKLILDYGFELVKEEARIPSSYIQSPWSMMKLQYECVFFVARKPIVSK